MKMVPSVLGVVLSVLCISGCGDGIRSPEISGTALTSRQKQPHSIGVAGVSVPSTCVQEDIVPVTVTVENQGNSSPRRAQRRRVIVPARISPDVAVPATVKQFEDITAGKPIGRKSLTLSAGGQGGMAETADLAFRNTGDVLLTATPP